VLYTNKVHELRNQFNQIISSIKKYYTSLKSTKMKKMIFRFMATLFSVIMIAFLISSCEKSIIDPSSDSQQASLKSAVVKSPTPAIPNFNLEVILHGENNSFGLIKFRQDNDAARIVTLDVWVRDLEPNHNYLLQRAVDTNLDGICTSTTWLTLGKGLALPPQPILTDATGTGREELWRDLSMIPSGTGFDIHFQIVDAVTSAVVLTSDCYQYTVR
jgi:hypothetical protein